VISPNTIDRYVGVALVGAIAVVILILINGGL
jgi:hypothetical protein